MQGKNGRMQTHVENILKVYASNTFYCKPFDIYDLHILSLEGTHLLKRNQHSGIMKYVRQQRRSFQTVKWSLSDKRS